MKSLPAALAAHLAARPTKLATALKITRSDGQIFGFTSHDQDAEISGVTYQSNPGLLVTDIVIAANPAVGNLELTTLHDGSVFTMQDVLGGVWRNAAFVLFRYNWSSISDGIDTLLAGTLGEFELRQNTVVAELRDLRQYLQQSVGAASSKTCRYRLGVNNGVTSRCPVNLVDFTETGSITTVTSNQVFRDSSRSEAANWFDEGEITFTSGNNSGITAKVKAYAANGTFTLALPLLGTVQFGDTYTAIAGCRKRLADCRDKFDVVLSFGGEPHRKGLNSLTKAPTPSV